MRRMQVIKIFILFVVIFVLAGCGKAVDNGLNWKVSDFNYTNQDGEAFGLSDLAGKVWIADFMFTNCITVCLPMTSNMAILQEMLAEQGIEAELVSFSIDPERDTPEVLKKYGEEYEADFSNWHFLATNDSKEIDKFARSSFNTVAVKERDSDQIIHSTSFYLVNSSGIVVQRYDGAYDTPFEEIIADVKEWRGRKGNKNAKTPTNEKDASLTAAASLYRQNCLACHGGELQGGFGPALQKLGAERTREQIEDVISNGLNKMPPFKGRLTEEQIETMVDWLASLK